MFSVGQTTMSNVQLFYQALMLMPILYVIGLVEIDDKRWLCGLNLKKFKQTALRRDSHFDNKHLFEIAPVVTWLFL